MAVRAKYRCTTIDPPGGIGQNIGLAVVTSGSSENESLFKWTPSGEIKLFTVNPAAAIQFELGAEYYVDFTKAEA